MLKNTTINHKDIEDSELLYLASHKNTLYNFGEKLVFLKKSAQKGNPLAQFYYGEMLYNINKKTALEMFHLSANGGSSQAEYKLGLIYSGNHGFKKNSEAERWLIFSASKQNDKALTLLESMLDKGIIQDQATVVLLIITNLLNKKIDNKSTFVQKIIDGYILPDGNANALCNLGVFFIME